MRAMVLRGKQLNLENVERPRPGPGQVLARVRACGICGSDLHFARHAEDLLGGRQTAEGVDAAAILSRGIVMGHEFVAEVTEAGPGAEAWAPGTRVTSAPVLPRRGDAGGYLPIGYSTAVPGAYGEYLLLSAALLLPVHDGLPDVIAATTEPCAVGLHAVSAARMQPGERALVMGAGPIGLMTLLWLKHAGVQQVIVSEYAAPRRELAARLGAEVVNPAEVSLAQRFQAEGGAPPVIFECVGVEGTLQQALDLAPSGGRIVVVGVCMTEDRIRPAVAITKELNLRFVYAYGLDEYREALGAITAGSIDTAPLVTRTVSLDELPAAFQSLGDPRDCKVMLTF